MTIHTKYRPKSLDEVFGNKHIKECLRSYFETDNRPHAFLFHGQSGTGKTTLARIIGNMAGCNYEDIVEYNIADDRGIDTGREIVQIAKHKPLFGKARMYILDEFHQASTHLQQSLLKILEEPPPHVYFAICTTEPGKIIQTIRGQRCVEFEVQPLTHKQSLKLLNYVVKKENARHITESTIAHIADISGGIPRKMLIFLGKAIAMKDQESVAKLLKVDQDVEVQAIELCRSLIKGESWSKIREIITVLTKQKGTNTPEDIRRMVLGYVNSIALNSNDIDPRTQLIFECFKEPFYNTGKVGLTFACLYVLTS